MSSSRRSSHSTRSFRQPPWRSSSMSKNTPAASLSYVFAEPEQGAPLASATAKLPVTRAPSLKSETKVGLLDDSSEHVAQLTQRLPPNGPVNEPVRYGITEGGVMTPITSSPSRINADEVVPEILERKATMENSSLQQIKPDTACTSTATMSVNAIPFPASPTSHPNPSLPALTTTLSAAPTKSSWFGSFSRPNEKSSLSRMNRVDSIAVANNVDRPVKLPLNQSSGEDAEGSSTQPSLLLLMSSPPVDSADTQLTIVEPVPDISSSHVRLADDTPPYVSDSSGPQAICAQAPVKRSWFSSSPPTSVASSLNTRTDVSTPMPTEPQQAAGTISNIITPQPIEHVEIAPFSDSSPPSSLDDTVPPLHGTPPANANLPQSTFGPSIDPLHLSSLNPTASRFTLSIPLLGRAKIPLESVLGAVKVKVNGSKDINVTDIPQAVEPQTPPSVITSAPETSGPSSELSPNTADSDHPHQGAPVSNTTSPISLSNVTPSTTNLDSMSVTPHPSTHSVESASWWDYLTRSSAPLSSTNPPIDPVPHTSSITHSPPSAPSIGGGNSADNNVSSPTIEPDVRSSETLPSTSLPSVPGISDSTNTTERVAFPKDDDKLGQHVDSGKGPVAASSWYTPWAWYFPTTDAVPTQQEVDLCNEKLAQEVQDVEGAERVPAGMDSNGTDTGKTNQEERVVEQEAPVPVQDKDIAINPIVQSMENQRTGWASFFSSRALLMKSIGYGNTLAGEGEVKRDKHGNEVMELDSDDEGDPGTRGREGLDDTNKSADATKGHIDKSLEVRNVGGKGNENANENEHEKTGLEKQPTAPPLTISEDVRRETMQSNPANNRSTSGGSKSGSGRSTPVPPNPASGMISIKGTKRTASPTPSKKSVAVPLPPNLVLPTWEDTFHTAPRNIFPPRSVPNDENVTEKFIGRTMKFVSGVLFAKETESVRKGKEREREEASTAIEREKRERYSMFGKELPRALQAQQDARRAEMKTDEHLGSSQPAGANRSRMKDLSDSQQGLKDVADVMKGCKKVVVIGIHGWFPGAVMRTMLGEPTGTSAKFVNMMVQALEEFQVAHRVVFDKITKIPLEGEGTIDRRVERLYNNLIGNQSWLDDLHNADAIFFATHSQGSIVTTHLLDRLIRENHIRTTRNHVVVEGMETFPSAVGINAPAMATPQKVCCLALCGIHLGPLRYLSSSSLVQPYIQYFESTAARELFEFQTTESDVSQAYVKALTSVVRHGTKMVYVASLNDQVVPIYSGLFTAASHPLILRALYIDGDAYHSSDFLSNLLVLLLRILNSGLSDSGLLAHLSEATAGSLNGVGHSTAYEEPATYSLAVNYLFLTDDGLVEHPELVVEPFNASHEQNDYEIPWALRDIIADDRVSHFFFREIAELRDAFREWQPKTTILRDLKRKLQPIQKLPSSTGSTSRL